MTIQQLCRENQIYKLKVIQLTKERQMLECDYNARLKADKVAMLDKIRAEIAELSHYYPMGHDYQIAITRCIAVIDKYKGESER